MNPLPPKPRVYLENNPTVTRLVPELAAVIGLNESILFLQIDFWIGQSEHFYEGCYWTFQSVRDMRKKAFPFWSIATINRTVVSLEAQHLVTVGNFNKRKGDTTRWFALNTEGIEKLSAKVPCITMIQGVFQNETPLPKDEIAREDPFQNETPVFQNETTLPEITTYKEKESPTSEIETTSLPSALSLAVDNAARNAYQPLDTDTAAMMQADVYIRVYEGACKARNAPQTIPRTRSNKRIAAQWYADGYTADEIRRAVDIAFEAGKPVPFAFLGEKLSHSRIKQNKASPIAGLKFITADESEIA